MSIPRQMLIEPNAQVPKTMDVWECLSIQLSIERSLYANISGAKANALTLLRAKT